MSRRLRLGGRKLRALRTWSRADRQVLAEAGLGLLSAMIAVRTLPFRHTARLLGLREGATLPDPTAQQIERAERVGWAIRAVTARAPWTSTCLMQAVAGAALLRRRRIPGQLHLGVAKDAADPHGLAAHAWLTCAGHVLTGDGPDRERYAVVGVYSVDAAQRT